MKQILNLIILLLLSATSVFGDGGLPDAYNSKLHAFSMPDEKWDTNVCLEQYQKASIKMVNCNEIF